MSYNILARFNNVVIDYNGKSYSKINNVPLFSSNVRSFQTNTFPYMLSEAFEYEETVDDFILKFYKIFADIESQELKIYSEKYNEIVYNKATQKSNGEKINSLVDFDEISTIDLAICLDKIIKTNDNVSNYLIAEAKKFNLIKNGDIGETNFTNLCIFNMLEFEKLINSKNTKLLISNLPKETFELSEANKLHKAVGLPKFAIQMIKTAKLENYMDALKKISEETDGNSFKIFLEFMINSKLLINNSVGKYNVEGKINEFLKDILGLVKANYRMVDLLNYLLRQSMYYNSQHKFLFPLDEANLLSDYVDMCVSRDLRYERYPSQLKKTHDIVAKNINTLTNISEELDEKFEEATVLYFEVEKTIETKDVNDPKKTKRFIFKIPTKIKEIIQEGNDLHHCVGSYANKIITGEACIVFMRDANAPDVPLITINIDKNYNLLEAKKNFNEEPEAEQLQVINKWLKELRN